MCSSLPSRRRGVLGSLLFWKQSVSALLAAPSGGKEENSFLQLHLPPLEGLQVAVVTWWHHA